MPELVSITGTGTPQPPSDAGKFTFWVWGDNRDGGTHFSEVLGKVKKAQPAFVFSLGDMAVTLVDLGT